MKHPLFDVPPPSPSRLNFEALSVFLGQQHTTPLSAISSCTRPAM